MSKSQKKYNGGEKEQVIELIQYGAIHVKFENMQSQLYIKFFKKPRQCYTYCLWICMSVCVCGKSTKLA